MKAHPVHRHSQKVLKFLLLAITVSPLAAQPFHRSAESLPLSNGATTAVFRVEDGSISDFSDHMYKKYDARSVTVDLADRATLDVVGAAGYDNLEYLVGTGILHSTLAHDGLKIERYYFAPIQGQPGRNLVMLARVGNDSKKVSRGVSLESTLDFHVGAGGWPDREDRSDDVDHQWRSTRGERLQKKGDAWFEWAEGSPYRLRYGVLGEPARARRGDVEGEEVAMLRWDIPSLKPGEEKWVGVVISQVGDSSSSALPADPAELLERELAFWSAYHAVEPSLSHLSQAEREVYRQSTAFLKMGQVKEAERPESSGQILASLKDKWARCWVRDSSYAIVALVRANHLEEARAALEFLLRTKKESEHDYLEMINRTLPPERRIDDYLVSVCRYWGSGEEESDWNEHGPNIEYDDFGLFLWAFSEYALALPPSEKESLLTQHGMAVREKVAEVLIRLTEEDGLLAPDSSIWEHHWNLPLAYDGRRHYAYSSITAWKGLSTYAKLLESMEEGKGALFQRAAERIREGVLEQLKDREGALAGSLEDLRERPEQPRDAAVLEAVAWGLLDDPGPTMRAVFDELASKTPGSPGLMRNDDGNWYDQQEWLLLDLRGVVAWRRMGENERADRLLQWVTGWAASNFNALGELLDENGDFQGPFPMAGFGPGAYVLATGR